MAGLSLERKQKLYFKLGQSLIGFTFIMHALLTIFASNKATDDVQDVWFVRLRSVVSVLAGILIFFEH